MAESRRLHRILTSVQGHYGYLLAALLTIFAIYPFTLGRSWVTVVLEGAYLATIVACLLVSLGKNAWRAILYAAIASELLTFASRMMNMSALHAPGRMLRVVVLFVVMLAVLRDVMRSREVTMNTVFAAASVYLLMALAWASIFMALESVDPGAFELTEAAGRAGMEPDAQLLYFSMITLTTVGYGDISPLSPQARTLAALEGLIGQLYVAIIIARLVALEISGRHRQHGNDGS
jgi:hypothetical protein